ncbi:MAG: hypothetical protein A3H02_00310 [Candidatus Niyogibacteria bacterium RIFCSPLOWO2_12_FULL_41_13]|uniref:Bis(5'-nucleosyl)-tetraphosphatase [asymmetrical] n=1 Tax=Candidatus Niyogibacteria bacterium RIFCSPLOWO2_12_FULL_41_13 TaxID=1801726 RepID=A0A1G2F4M0_9BACT|nr:MAG: hypothetical protein A3H02_00310 [Candidatus Niyogibacteria bacterium RIFCSPLOWO2_12_FULL_41_13]
MTIEKSAGAVVFRKENNKRFYLLLEKENGQLDFPKGNIEKGEKAIDAAARETKEEAGIDDLKFVDGFKETIKVFYKWEGELRLKFITFFLAETKTRDVKISFEHKDYQWLPYEEAVLKLTFKNSKEILKKAEKLFGLNHY